jgi:hypothetical protein
MGAKGFTTKLDGKETKETKEQPHNHQLFFF